MAVTSTPTLLPLDRFAAILGLNPLHFNQVDADIGAASSRVAIKPIMQYSWQDADAVSREEIAQYVYDAEFAIATELGFWPAPKWTVQERVPVVPSYMPGTWWSGNRDITGDIFSIKAPHGMLISGGWKAKILVDAAAAITYSDVDGDGYDETATITAATTVTNEDEIAIYYPGKSGSDEWEVRPTVVSITGGVATIVCRREQLVLESLLTRLDAHSVNGLDDANFLTTVDVYRKYNDPNKQVEFFWRNTDLCNCSGSCQCSLSVQNGCMTVKDNRLGIVTMSPGEWNDDTGGFDGSEFTVCRRPDYVRLWYRSGYRDLSLTTPNIRMARELEQAVTKLAISKLDRIIRGSRGVEQVQEKWRIDLRGSYSTQARSNSMKVTNYELENCPFGTTVAAMEVWRLVRRMQLGA